MDYICRILTASCSLVQRPSTITILHMIIVWDQWGGWGGMTKNISLTPVSADWCCWTMVVDDTANYHPSASVCVGDKCLDLSSDLGSHRSSDSGDQWRPWSVSHVTLVQYPRSQDSAGESDLSNQWIYFMQHINFTRSTNTLISRGKVQPRVNNTLDSDRFRV